VLAVAEAAAGEEDGEVFGGMTAAVAKVAAEEDGGVGRVSKFEPMMRSATSRSGITTSRAISSLKAR
jgi:hypothetical protein